MAEELITMRAYVPLDDPDAGHVPADTEFACSKQNSAFYTKTGAAGPPGASAREVQLEVAAEETYQRNEAKRMAKAGRAGLRNLVTVPKAGLQGNVAAVDPMPAKYGENQDAADVRTNQQGRVGGPLTPVSHAKANEVAVAYKNRSKSENVTDAEARGLDVTGKNAGEVIKALEEDDKKNG